MTLEEDGRKAVWGNLGPDSIYVDIVPTPQGVLQMHGTVGTFSWEQTIEKLSPSK